MPAFTRENSEFLSVFYRDCTRDLHPVSLKSNGIVIGLRFSGKSSRSSPQHARPLEHTARSVSPKSRRAMLQKNQSLWESTNVQNLFRYRPSGTYSARLPRRIGLRQHVRIEHRRLQGLHTWK